MIGLSIKSNLNKRLIAFVIILTIPLSGSGIDIYMPSLPMMQAYFHTSSSMIQSSVSCYLLGSACAQPFVGWLMDGYGRKNPRTLALVLFLLVTLAISFTTNIFVLLLLRFIQGALTGAIHVGLRSSVTDIFSGKELYLMANYITISWAMAPILAPALGGYLQHYFGWKADFIFLFAYGVVCLILLTYALPETIPNKNPASFATFRKNVNLVLSHRVFLGVVAGMGISYALLLLFSVASPYVYEGDFSYTPIQFGHTALLMGVAWLIGNIINRVTMRFSPTEKLRILTISSSLIGLVLFTTAKINFLHPHFLTAITFILVMFAAITYVNYFAKAISMFPQIAATAGAVMGTGMTVISVLVGSEFGSSIPPGNLIDYTWVLFVVVFANFIIYAQLNKSIEITQPNQEE